MKKLVMFISAILLAVGVFVTPASAAYLPQYDQTVEVTYEQARELADSLGLKGVPLGEKTAELSFKMQEKEIAKLEKEQNIEIDHYYTWYTVNGEVVLGIDPPVPGY